MSALAGLVVIALAIYAIVRRIDVRLTLLAAAAVLGVLCGDLPAVVRKFFTTLTAEEFLVPICTAMGFAHVLRSTQCDRHLVQLLARPLQRARRFVLPGAVLVAFVVNVPIISQTSTAATVGSVLVPLMSAAGIPQAQVGATLLLGSSVGGELLNQGAPEFRTVIREISALGRPAPSGADCVRVAMPFVMLHLLVATGVFWWISARAPRDAAATEAPPVQPDESVRHVKAIVPLVPLVLLFLAGPPLRLLAVPQEWLVGPRDPSAANPFDSRLIGAAMVVGAVVAALTDGRRGMRVVESFFEGAGFALTHIISIIVAAACFGEGVKLLGFDRLVASALASAPHLLVPAAGLVPMAFGALCGSGMAATQALFGLFAAPAVELTVAPEKIGAIVSLGAAAGRTMSPVAAVAIMCGSLTGTPATELARRVAAPLVAGIATIALVGSALVLSGSWDAVPMSAVTRVEAGP